MNNHTDQMSKQIKSHAQNQSEEHKNKHLQKLPLSLHSLQACIHVMFVKMHESPDPYSWLSTARRERNEEETTPGSSLVDIQHNLPL